MKRLLASILFFTSFGVAMAEMNCRMDPRTGRMFCTETDPGPAVVECENPSNGRGYKYSAPQCFPMVKDPVTNMWHGLSDGEGHQRFSYVTSESQCREINCISRVIVRTSATAPSSEIVPAASPSPFRRLLSTLGITRTAAPTPSFRASSSSGNAANSASAPASSYAAAPASPAAAVTPVTPASYVEGMIAAQPAVPAVTAPTTFSEEYMRTMMESFRAQLTCNDVNKRVKAVLESLFREGISGSEAWLKVNRMGYAGLCNATYWEEKTSTGWVVFGCKWTPEATPNTPDSKPHACLKVQVRPRSN